MREEKEITRKALNAFLAQYFPPVSGAAGNYIFVYRDIVVDLGSNGRYDHYGPFATWVRREVVLNCTLQELQRAGLSMREFSSLIRERFGYENCCSHLEIDTEGNRLKLIYPLFIPEL